MIGCEKREIMWHFQVSLITLTNLTLFYKILEEHIHFVPVQEAINHKRMMKNLKEII